MKEVSRKIINHIGIISKNNSINKEINLISWNGNEPVYDIRNIKVNDDGTLTFLKGITLNKEELFELKEIICEMGEK